MQAVGDLAPTVRLRPTRAEDADFLFELYASTRAAELDRTGWDETTKLGFLQMQFAAQSAYYARHFATAQFDVIEADGQPVGRRASYEEEIRIIDVTLCRPGATVDRHAVDSGDPRRGRASVRSVGLSVERWNSACRLYARLGFREESSDDVYVRMRSTLIETR